MPKTLDHPNPYEYHTRFLRDFHKRITGEARIPDSVKRAALRRANFKCELTGRKHDLEVVHRGPSINPSKPELKDVIVLNRKVHLELMHNEKDIPWDLTGPKGEFQY
jgi:hypothetical protein